jgi:hypothetical protein
MPSIDVFLIVEDPSDKLHASKHGLLLRRGQYVWGEGPQHYRLPSEEGLLLGLYLREEEAKQALTAFEAERSWLYVHRYRVGFWGLLGIAVITVPWSHYINNDPWIEAPAWVGAIWLFFASLAYTLVELFWPKHPRHHGRWRIARAARPSERWSRRGSLGRPSERTAVRELRGGRPLRCSAEPQSPGSATPTEVRTSLGRPGRSFLLPLLQCCNT